MNADGGMREIGGIINTGEAVSSTLAAVSSTLAAVSARRPLAANYATCPANWGAAGNIHTHIPLSPEAGTPQQMVWCCPGRWLHVRTPVHAAPCRLLQSPAGSGSCASRYMQHQPHFHIDSCSLVGTEASEPTVAWPYKGDHSFCSLAV